MSIHARGHGAWAYALRRPCSTTNTHTHAHTCIVVMHSCTHSALLQHTRLAQRPTVNQAPICSPPQQRTRIRTCILQERHPLGGRQRRLVCLCRCLCANLDPRISVWDAKSTADRYTPVGRRRWLVWLRRVCRVVRQPPSHQGPPQVQTQREYGGLCLMDRL